jgi:hypothetical protein
VAEVGWGGTEASAEGTAMSMWLATWACAITASRLAMSSHKPLSAAEATKSEESMGRRRALSRSHARGAGGCRRGYTR